MSLDHVAFAGLLASRPRPCGALIDHGVRGGASSGAPEGHLRQVRQQQGQPRLVEDAHPGFPQIGEESRREMQHEARRRRRRGYPGRDALPDRMLEVYDIKATYYVDKITDRKVVQIRDARNDRLIRQVPSQDFLEHARTLHELMGLLFAKQV